MQPMYQLTLLRRAVKDCDALTQKDRVRVDEIFAGLLIDPYVGKKLCGVFAGCYALRAWPNRIIYIINKNKKRIFIVRVGHRKDIYK